MGGEEFRANWMDLNAFVSGDERKQRSGYPQTKKKQSAIPRTHTYQFKRAWAAKNQADVFHLKY